MDLTSLRTQLRQAYTLAGNQTLTLTGTNVSGGRFAWMLAELGAPTVDVGGTNMPALVLSGIASEEEIDIDCDVDGCPLVITGTTPLYGLTLLAAVHIYDDDECTIDCSLATAPAQTPHLSNFNGFEFIAAIPEEKRDIVDFEMPGIRVWIDSSEQRIEVTGGLTGSWTLTPDTAPKQITLRNFSVSIVRITDFAWGTRELGFTLTGSISIGSVTITASLSAPVGPNAEAGTWIIRVSASRGQARGVDIYDILGIFVDRPTVEAALPPGSNVLSQFVLMEMTAMFSLSNFRFGNVSVMVGAASTTPGGWEIVSGLSLSNVTITAQFDLTDATPRVGIVAAGEFLLTGKTLIASVSKVPGSGEWTITLLTAEPITLTAAASLPGGPDLGAVNLPSGLSGDSSLSVEQFALTIRPGSAPIKWFSLDVIVLGNWTIISNWLAVSNVQLVLEVTEPLNASLRSFSGALTGVVTIPGPPGSEEPLIEAEFGMARSEGRWSFTLDTEAPFKVSDLMKKVSNSVPADWLGPFQNVKVDSLSVEYITGVGTLPGEFTGAIVLSDVATFNFPFGDTPFIITQMSARLFSTIGSSANPPNTRSMFFSASATFEIYKKPIVAFFEYDSMAAQPSWKIGAEYDGFRGVYYKEADPVQSRFEISFGDRTVADIIRKVAEICRLEAGTVPANAVLEGAWDILGGLSLQGLTLMIFPNQQASNWFGLGYTFTPEVNLGFYSLRRITVYLTREKKVRVTVEGTPIGSSAPASLGWNLGERTPPMPGSAAKLFDLRFLAIGQRLRLGAQQPGTLPATRTTVLQTITQMKSALGAATTDPGSANPVGALSGVAYDATRNWLIGVDFSVLGFLSLALVFNDGNVAGVRLGINGDRFPKLTGLDFEILYKKVTESVGVYQIELRVPDAFRQFDLGQVSITLPVIAVDIYTNGNFRVDLGFPKNNDFSRSFMLQVLPFLGSGGFYFALLEGSTASRLPADYIPQLGAFKPVIEFGIGLSLGVGKIIDKGIFRAELSLTFQGILEGILAFFNANPAWNGRDGLYYRLQGTFGVVGRIQGSVSFAVITANVLLEAYARISVVFESHRPIVLTFTAGVNANLTVRVGGDWLGVDIDCSFSTEISESFTLPSPDQDRVPVWADRNALVPRTLQMPGDLRALMAGDEPPAPSQIPDLNWVSCIDLTAAEQRDPLYIAFRPQFAVARDADGSQQVHYVAMLFLDGTPGLNQTKSDFARIAEAVLLWSINALLTTVQPAAILTKPQLAAWLATNVVTADDLTTIYNVLTSRANGRAPFTSMNVTHMLQTLFDVRIWAPGPGPGRRQTPGRSGSSNERPGVVPFPMIPELQLTTTMTRGAQVVGSTSKIFRAVTPVPPEYSANVAAYFSELAMQFQNELEKKENPRRVIPPPEGERGMASYVFEDYFLLVARAVIQASLDAMKSFTLRVVEDDTLAGIAGRFGMETFEIAEDLRDVPLKVTPATPAMRTSGTSVRITSPTSTLASVAYLYMADADDPFLQTMIEANAFTPNLLVAGTIVAHGDVRHTITPTDTLADIAFMLSPGSSPADILASIAYDPVYLRDGAELFLPYGLREADTGAESTYRAFAARFTHAPQADPLSDAFLSSLGNFNAYLPFIFPPDRAIILPCGEPYVTGVGDRLIDIAWACAVPVTPGELLVWLSDESSIMQAGVPLLIPPVEFSPADGQTLGELAAFHGVSVTALAVANVVGPQFKAHPTPIRLRDVRQVMLGSLLEEVSAGGLDNVGKMTSRFMLPGLRLPRPSDNNYAGPWGNDATRPLYVLTGQQVKINEIDPADLLPGALNPPQFQATLDWPAQPGLAWFTFEKPMAPVAGDATVTLDVGELRWVTGLRLADLVPSIRPMRKAQLVADDVAEFAFGRRVELGPAVSFGGTSSQGCTLWSISDALQRILARGWSTFPIFDMMLRDESVEGIATSAEPAGRHCWASAVDVRVKRIARVAGGAHANAYEIDGTGPEGLVRLEKIIRHAASRQGFVREVHILYPGSSPASLAGASSGDLGAFIQYTNLATLSNPPALTATPFSAPPPTLQNFVNTRPLQSLRLLWQACSVRSGGYYLYYQAGNSGFPDRIFGEDGSATVTFLITFDIGQEGVPPFADRVVAGDPVRPEQRLYAVSAEQTVSFDVDTLSPAQMIARHGLRPVSLMPLIIDREIEHDCAIRIEGHQFQLSQTYTDWNEVAGLFAGVTGDDISLLNPGVAPNAGVTVIIPPFWTLTGAGDRISTLAIRYGVSAASIVYNNASSIYYAGGRIEGARQQLTRKSPTVPVGHVGVQLFRDPPVDQMFYAGENTSTYDDAWFRNQLQYMYSLISFRVDGNAWFRSSIDSLPSGPGKRPSAYPDPLPPLTDWQYDQLFPLYPFWKHEIVGPPQPGEPSPSANPYRGVGRLFGVAASVRDIFGNATNLYQPGENGALGIVPDFPFKGSFVVGYTDEIVGLEQWPGAQAGYFFYQDGADPKIQLTIGFNGGRYVLGVAEQVSAKRKLATADLEIFRKVYYQLTWGRNDLKIEDSISQDSHALGTAFVLGFLRSVIGYLTALADGTGPLPVSSNTLFSTTTDYQVPLANSAAYFPLTVRLTIRRNDPVDDAFVDVPGVREVSTEIEPITDARVMPHVPAGTDPSVVGTHRAFAAAFERAYGDTKIATGMASHADADIDSRTRLWVVQLGPTGRIRSTIRPERQYFFAIPPLATFLLAARDVPVRRYTTAGGMVAAPAKSYGGIDIDAWARRFLEAVDTVLGAEYAIAAYLLDLKATAACPETSTGRKCYAAIVDAKKRLADTIAGSVARIAADTLGDLGLAAEALRQRLLTRLSSAYEVDAVVQLGVDVTAPFTTGDPFVEKLFGQMRTEQSAQQRSEDRREFTLSTGRIPLNGPSSFLTFLFRSEKAVPEQKFDLKLKFDAAAFEYDIADMPPATGLEFASNETFRTSSWLTFVLPLSTGTAMDVSVPVPIRSCPVPPSLLAQSITPVVGRDMRDPVPMDDTKLWKYTYSYDRILGGRDAVYTTLWFNAPRPSAPIGAAPDGIDLFQALATFENAWDDIQKDLFPGLRQVRPGATGTDIDKAEKGLAAFAWIATKVADAWPSWASCDRAGYEPPPGDNRDNALFVVIDEPGPDGLLQVTIRKCLGDQYVPVPSIVIDGIVTDEQLWDVEGERVFLFKRSILNTEPTVTWAESGAYRKRTLVFDGIDILSKQNVWAGIYTTRNENLLANVSCAVDPPVRTNPAFIYRTPRVRFSNPVTPLLEYHGPIDVAALRTPPDASRIKPLLEHMRILFAEYFKSVIDPDAPTERKVLVTLRYNYDLRDPLRPASPDPLVVTLPVLLAPTFTFALPADSLTTPATTFVRRLTDTILQWNRDRSPVTTNAELIFEISVYSSLDPAVDKVPSYSLSNVRLKLEDVTEFRAAP